MLLVSTYRILRRVFCCWLVNFSSLSQIHCYLAINTLLFLTKTIFFLRDFEFHHELKYIFLFHSLGTLLEVWHMQENEVDTFISSFISSPFHALPSHSSAFRETDHDCSDLTLRMLNHSGRAYPVSTLMPDCHHLWNLLSETQFLWT